MDEELIKAIEQVESYTGDRHGIVGFVEGGKFPDDNITEEVRLIIKYIRSHE